MGLHMALSAAFFIAIVASIHGVDGEVLAAGQLEKCVADGSTEEVRLLGACFLVHTTTEPFTNLATA